MWSWPPAWKALKREWADSWRTGLSIATDHDGSLLPSVPEAACLLESVPGQYREDDAVAACLFVGFLEVASWPLRKWNAVLGGPLVCGPAWLFSS